MKKEDEDSNTTRPSSSASSTQRKKRRYRKKSSTLRTGPLHYGVDSSDEEYLQPTVFRSRPRSKSDEESYRFQLLRKATADLPEDSESRPSSEESKPPSAGQTKFQNVGTFDVESDVLMRENEESGSMIWAPLDPYCLVFDPETYKEFKHISMTVHLHEYFDVRDKGEFLPRPINHDNESGLPSNIEGVWFRAVQPEEHNKHGNVSFVVPFKKILRHLFRVQSYQLYMLEIYQSPTRCVSRFAIAQVDDPELPSYLMPYNPRVFGGPWFVEDGSVGDRFPTVIRGFKSKKMFPVKHEIEFFFKFSSSCYRLLYSIMDVVPTEHKQSNNGKPNMCVRYRSGPPEAWVDCPNPLSITEVRDLLDDDSRMQTFSMYLSWKIKQRAESYIQEMNSTAELLKSVFDKTLPTLLVSLITKTKESSQLVIDNKTEEKLNEEIVQVEENIEKRLKRDKKIIGALNEHLGDIAVVDENVAKVIARITSDALDLRGMYQKMFSETLDKELEDVINETADDLSGIVSNCLTTLAMEMKVSMGNEMESGTVREVKKSLRHIWKDSY